MKKDRVVTCSAVSRRNMKLIFVLVSEIEEQLDVWIEKYGSASDSTKQSIASLQICDWPNQQPNLRI